MRRMMNVEMGIFEAFNGEYDKKFSPIHDVRGEQSREFFIFYLPPAAAGNVPSINAAVSHSSGCGRRFWI
jgi:hypothetical protein